MVGAMKRLALSALLLVLAAPAFAGASNFTLVNGTAAPLAQVSITRSGTHDWQPLAQASAAGARSSVTFSNPDCAFDIRANVAGVGPVTWAGVNLCDVKSVVLKRDATAGAWVDYDQ
jgi:hypothetical protein